MSVLHERKMCPYTRTEVPIARCVSVAALYSRMVLVLPVFFPQSEIFRLWAQHALRRGEISVGRGPHSDPPRAPGAVSAARKGRTGAREWCLGLAAFLPPERTGESPSPIQKTPREGPCRTRQTALEPSGSPATTLCTTHGQPKSFPALWYDKETGDKQSS